MSIVEQGRKCVGERGRQLVGDGRWEGRRLGKLQASKQSKQAVAAGCCLAQLSLALGTHFQRGLSNQRAFTSTLSCLLHLHVF